MLNCSSNSDQLEQVISESKQNWTGSDLKSSDDNRALVLDLNAESSLLPRRKFITIAALTSAAGIGTIGSVFYSYTSQSNSNPYQEWICSYTLRRHTDLITSLATNTTDNKRVFASGSRDDTIKIWSLHSGDLIQDFPAYSEGVTSLAFSSDGRTLVSGGRDNTVKVWDWTSGTIINTLPGHKTRVISLAFNSKDQILISAGDEEINLWDFKSTSLISNFSTKFKIVSLASSPNSDYPIIAVGGYSGLIELWNIKAVRLIYTKFVNSGNFIRFITISPDGKTLLISTQQKVGDESLNGKFYIESSKSEVILQDLLTGRKLGVLLPAYSEARKPNFNSLAVSPDGRTVAGGNDSKTIYIWDLRTKGIINILNGHENSVNAVAFSFDGKKLVSASLDGIIKIWSSKHSEKY